MNELRITTEKAELDIPSIHQFLSGQTTWAKGIPLAVVQRSIEHSLCFGAFIGNAQVAFARVISNYATFANLVDVFVLPGHRGKGYSKVLMSAVVAHPQLQGLRRMMLATRTHGRYRDRCFAPLLPCVSPTATSCTGTLRCITQGKTICATQARLRRWRYG